VTNATKAQIIVLINAIFSAVVVFGIFTAEQAGSLGLVANAALGVYVAMTYKDSPKRVPEGLEVDPGPPPHLESEGS
jgi:hypothetical protein